MSEVSYKSLGDALDRLREAIDLYERHKSGEFLVSMRNSMILTFEFTYGLCRPMIERYLIDAEDEDPVRVEEMGYAELIRTANELGLIRVAWREWAEFRRARNLTAHAYSEPRAEEIAVLVPSFYAEARHLYEAMTERSAKR